MKPLLQQANEVLSQGLGDTFDHLRPTFHITPVKGLLNDPNGFIEINGEYHLFYQWNPFACDHSAKYWGHKVSRDLMNWESKPTAIAPDESYDRNGCYSGSAFMLNNEMHLFYTGNLKDENNHRYSTQCIAKAVNSDNSEFTKLGPVIFKQPDGYTAHFRDPKIWQHNGQWYCVLGAQTDNELGQVLVYRSDDAVEWEYLGPIAGNGINGLDNFGYMFECPDLFCVDDVDVLLGCPQGMNDDSNNFQNVDNNGYFLGQFDYSTNTYTHNEFKPLDQGFEFYAPQTTQDSKGRRLLSAWIGLPGEEDLPTTEHGWVHALSMVREINVSDGVLTQRPSREHISLRKESLQITPQTLEQGIPISIETDNCFEMNLSAHSIVDSFRIRLAEIDDHYIELSFDPTRKLLTLDRSHANNQTGSRECVLNESDKLDLQIFFDHSIIEIFVNNGQEVFTSNVFPQQATSKVTLLTDNSCIISRLIKYDY